MRDLTFISESGAVNVKYRTDLIGSESKNFTVFQIFGLEDPTLDNPEYDRINKLSVEFKRLSYNLFAFKAFADLQGLRLVSSETDGSDPVVLVDYSDSDSES